jgi:hypothetical protein
MPVSSDNLMRSAERTLSQQPEAAIEMVRRTRDSAEEQGFRNLYRY